MYLFLNYNIYTILYDNCSDSLFACLFFLILLAVWRRAIVLHSPSSSQLNDGLQLFIECHSCQSGCSADLMKDYWCWFLSLLLSVAVSPLAWRSFIVKGWKKIKNPILSCSSISITFPCQGINLICSTTNLQTKHRSCNNGIWPLVIELIISLWEECSLVG